MKKVILSFAALLLAAGGAFAQSSGVPFSVLSNNTDKAGKNLFVEIMYEKPACNDAQAKFFITYDNAGTPDTTPAVKVQVLNNPGTFDEEAYRRSDSTTISRPTAAGYRLKVPLGGIKADQNPQLCVSSYSVAYRCVGCGAAGSDAIFNESSIRAGCPYDRSANNDLLACKPRLVSSGSTVVVDHWEAWVLDPRDCQPYRAVLMPDGRWWFAQNLSYTKELEGYACPGGASLTTPAPLGNNASTASGGTAACATYGVLYPWSQASSLNGRGTFAAQGICPDGWRVPQDYDFGVLLDALEDNPAHQNNLGDAGFGGSLGTSYLKSTHSARPSVAKVDSSYATATNPVWAWHRADTLGKVALPHVSLGMDRYGFKLLPAGYAQGGNHFYLGAYAVLWTLTESDPTHARAREVRWSHRGTYRASFSKSVMASVRCLRGEAPPAGGTATPTLAAADGCYGAPVTVRVGNPGAFPGGPFTFEVAGVQQALGVPYLTLPASTPAGTYAIRVKVGESAWSAAKTIVVEDCAVPQLTVADARMGEVAVRIANTGDFSSTTYTFEVNGSVRAAAAPELSLTNAGAYTVRAKVGGSDWSEPGTVNICTPLADLTLTPTTDKPNFNTSSNVFTAASPSLGTLPATFSFTSTWGGSQSGAGSTWTPANHGAGGASSSVTVTVPRSAFVCAEVSQTVNVNVCEGVWNGATCFYAAAITPTAAAVALPAGFTATANTADINNNKAYFFNNSLMKGYWRCGDCNARAYRTTTAAAPGNYAPGLMTFAHNPCSCAEWPNATVNSTWYDMSSCDGGGFPATFACLDRLAVKRN